MQRNAFTPPIILAVCSTLGLLTQPPAATAGQTIINGHTLTKRQQIEWMLVYRTPPAVGNFWYDARSGMWGVWGHEVSGVLKPGHNYGPLSPDASNGNTSVFINGRQLNLVEAMYLQQRLGVPIQAGRCWLDAAGNFGIEGNLMPLGNVASLVSAKQPHRVLTEHDINGGFSNSAGTCTKSGNCYFPNR